MSRHQINEQEMEQEIAARVAKHHARHIAAWLKCNPSIGQLNGGLYYRMENDLTVSVQPLEGFYSIVERNMDGWIVRTYQDGESVHISYSAYADKADADDILKVIVAEGSK